MASLHEDEGSSGGQGGDIRPVPDPTKLTNEAVDKAVGNLEARILVRLDAMDHATDLRLKAMDRIPEDTNKEINHAVAFIEEKFKTVDIRFQGIAQQFHERDIRVETGARASAEALQAALLAAKELVGTTNEANTIAARKSEESVAKQIDAISTQIRTTNDGIEGRIADLKERIDRGEGQHQGGLDARALGVIMLTIILSMIGIGIAAVSLATR